MASIPELLKSVLPEKEYALLERLTRGWKDNLFHFDRKSGEFELADDWLLRYGADREQVLDLLLRSCEVLSSRVAELDQKSLGHGGRGRGETEEFSLSFTFDAGARGSARSDLAVADRFVDLLVRDPVYRLSVVDGPNAKMVRVSFSFRSDHEFFTRKNQVQWLLETARRLSSDSPFGGTKL
ncbi:MAG: hypothetical protein M1379_04755 [Firmicutes bacterium]|nr:hypothetical protein [Bacillota bacterium]